MSLLDLDLLIATFIAFGIGLAVLRSWRLKLALCIMVALVAWAVRYIAILNGDVTVAEDYVNGLSALTGAAELAVALAWAAFWCALGTAVAFAIRRMRASAP